MKSWMFEMGEELYVKSYNWVYDSKVRLFCMNRNEILDVTALMGQL